MSERTRPSLIWKIPLLALLLVAATASGQDSPPTDPSAGQAAGQPPGQQPGQQPGQPPGLAGLTITLKPGGLDAAGNPAFIDLATRVSGLDFVAGEPFLRIPAQFAGVPGVAYDKGNVQVEDEQGSVPIAATVDEPDEGGFIYFRRFTTERDTQGTVLVSYRAPIEMVVPKLGAGPPFDLRSQGGGFSGAGNTFILMPDTSQPFLIGIEWQLDALKPGSIGVSSFGQGDTLSPGPVDRIIASYFMAGPIGQYPADTTDAKFSGYWIGSPKFDASDILQWSEKAYGFISAYFDDADPPAYRVLMRGNPYPGGGGAALMSSFLVSFPDDQEDGHSLRETIAHETVHNWVSSIAGPPGSSSWYSEGMTVALTRRILLRSGLFSPQEFLDSVNDSALSYYTNALNNTPNDQIAAGFWRDTRIRSLPYSRGPLYFADVDAAVRQKSGGQRSLDDLARAFNERREAGEEVSGDTWRELVTAELGEAGGKGLDGMLAGALVIPPSDAFGPCFTREESKVRRFELGFTRESLFDEPRLVSGLVAGSEAEKVGIREGDTILQPVPLEAAQSDPEKKLKLQLSRDGKAFDVEYLPRGEAVTTYLWQRVADVPDSRCAL
jgi:hypothetical protein